MESYIMEKSSRSRRALIAEKSKIVFSSETCSFVDEIYRKTAAYTLKNYKIVYSI